MCIRDSSSLGELDAMIACLFAIPTETEPEYHPAPAQMVEGGEQLCQHDGIVLGSQDHAGTQVDPRGHRGRHRQGHKRIETAPVVLGMDPLHQGPVSYTHLTLPTI